MLKWAFCRVRRKLTFPIPSAFRRVYPGRTSSRPRESRSSGGGFWQALPLYGLGQIIARGTRGSSGFDFSLFGGLGLRNSYPRNRSAASFFVLRRFFRAHYGAQHQRRAAFCSKPVASQWAGADAAKTAQLLRRRRFRPGHK